MQYILIYTENCITYSAAYPNLEEAQNAYDRLSLVKAITNISLHTIIKYGHYPALKHKN